MANKYELRRRALKESGDRGEIAGAARRGKTGEKTGGYVPPPRMDRLGLTAALCLGLVVLVTALYVQTWSHDFTVCDDNVYIYEKPQIVSGLTWENVKWAFTDHEGNWHPLTWITHMLDWQLFSQGSWQPENLKYGYSWPGGHHLVNMALHCANAVLLFLALRLMTGALWPCLVVAVLFAAHPLRVESVAWAAERKDVLCGLFWMATMLVYAIYAKRPPLARSTTRVAVGTALLFLLVNVFMAFGLMAKSMIVTLPCVLILLDIWPLGRWKKIISPPGRVKGDIDLLGGMLLLMEKVPLFAMVAGDCYVEVAGQERGVALNSLAGLPMSARLLNAVESCGEYLRQTLWPSGLSPFYAHQYMLFQRFNTEFYIKFWISLAILIAITVLSIFFFRRRTYLAVGWFWYLGALMPVIGIVQVGTQARADRYTYLPMIGVYIMVAWLLKEVADRWPSSRRMLAAGGVVVLVAMSTVTFRQVGLWINSYALFKDASGIKDEDYFGYIDNDPSKPVDLEKARKVAYMADKTKDNYFAFNHIGIAYDKDGKELAKSDQKKSEEAFDRSAAAFAATLAIKPDYDFGNNNLGVYFARVGKSHDAKAAEKFFRQAINVNQRYADAYNNLGIVLAEQGAELARQGKFAEAIVKLEDSARQHMNGLQVRPDRASDHNNLCRVFLQMTQVHKGAAEKARTAHESSKAEEERKLQAEALKNAMRENEVALQCDRNFVGAFLSRIEILGEQNKPWDKEAIRCYERIIAIDPTHDGIRALGSLVNHYEEQKESDKSIKCLGNAGESYLQAVAAKVPSLEFAHMPLVLANAYVSLKQPDKAARWLDQAGEVLNQVPNSPENLSERLKLGLFCVKAKQPGKALVWLNQVLGNNSSLTEVYAARACAYEMQGNMPNAQADYDRIMRASLPERFKAAQLYLFLDQPDKAIAMLNQMLLVNGNIVELYDARGAAYEAKSDYARAKADYEHVLQLNPQYPGIREKLKMVTEKLAKPQ
jgi:protein O-mannosyl-transferase